MILIDLIGARRFDVNNARHTSIDFSNAQGPTGLYGNVKSGITQGMQQGDAALLRQRLAPCHGDVPSGVGLDFFQDVVNRLVCTTLKRVGGITIAATERASGQTHENRWQPDPAGFSLQREENLGNAQGG